MTDLTSNQGVAGEINCEQAPPLGVADPEHYNPTFRFWSHEFVHYTPEIQKLFMSVAQSCMVVGQPRQEMLLNKQLLLQSDLTSHQ